LNKSGEKMANPTINRLFENTTETKLSYEFSKSDALSQRSDNILNSVKDSLLDKISDFDSLSNLSIGELGSFAKSLGLDTNKLDKILDITSEINFSDIANGDINSIKQKLLEKLELKNLINDALNPDVLKMLAESIGISIPSLEKMLNSSIKIKTFSDIKSMVIYNELDSVFKKKLIDDNGLRDEKLLESVIKVSTLLYSKDETDRKEAETLALTLELDFVDLMTPRETEPDKPNYPNTVSIEQSIWVTDFSKIDYRVQKVAAMALGFGSEETGVLELRDMIDKMKKFKELSEQSKSLRESLIEHVENIEVQSNYNKDAFSDYKKEHGLSDEQFDESIKTTFSREFMDFGEDDQMCSEPIDPDERDNPDTSDIEKFGSDSNRSDDPIWNLGLNPSLVIRNQTTNEILGYNGDIVLTNKKNFTTKEPITDIPFKFNTVNGNFICRDMGLTKLTNAPDIVTGNFDCANNNLRSLTGAPKQVNGEFNAANNKITSLEGIPASSGGITLRQNDISSLDISYPVSILNGGDFNVSNNDITSLLSGDITVDGEFNVSRNKLTNSELNLQQCLIRVRTKFVAKNQNDGPLNVKLLQDKFGNDIIYDI
jgi:hypothetical protein